jgi:hypothetical protein
VLVCGCMSAIGPRLICKIEGRVYQYVYHEISEANLFYGAFSKYDLNASIVIFQNDNDLKHTTKTMKQWLSKQPIKVVLSITQPIPYIEYLWATLNWKLDPYPTPPKGFL